MNILLVSQCSGRAINKTSRILDQFAERRGDRVWQTSITQAGLGTLRKLLKSNAQRNSAIACHWIRGKDRSELIWVVGDANRFNPEGTVPTNTTRRNILRTEDENQWQYGELIRLATGLAALFHDFGKANALFQRKLKENKRIAEPYRHEWVSLRLFQAIIDGCSTDVDWLKRLSELNEETADDWQQPLKKIQDSPAQGNATNSPFKSMPPFAQLVGWLIVSHHRLPYRQENEKTGVKRFDCRRLRNVLTSIAADWNSQAQTDDAKELKHNWQFDNGIPTNSQSWRKKANILANRALVCSQITDTAAIRNPFVSHISRLCLMWGDHYYSSLPDEPLRGDKGYKSFANTWFDKGSPRHGELRQRLDEHLLGVAQHSAKMTHLLPLLQTTLPRIAQHKGFKRRSKNSRFRWQDRAYELARSIQQDSSKHGFFGINMASTGCGKTLANGRIMYGLANPHKGARFTIALGLRTLTLQTGDAYRDRLELGNDDLAVMVGGAAVRKLHEMGQSRQNQHQQAGSESAANWLEDNQYVHYEGMLADGPFNDWLKQDPRIQKLLNAPILTCTIDHIMPATEGIRGGRQIAPMLRLLTSDLVLDEPDDFGLEDLPALTRLVHWAGLLGSRVLLSSATLPPAIVEGLFNAYCAGRESYQQCCGQPGLPVNVHCAWFDEFDRQYQQTGSADNFASHHQAFINKRLAKLEKPQPRVHAAIAELPIVASSDEQAIRQQFAEEVLQQAIELHKNNSETTPGGDKRVSFGLLRMANINPLVDVTKALYQLQVPDDHQLHLCCYHSQHPLMVRSAIEQTLDACLNRQQPEAAFEQPEIAGALAKSPAKNHIFLVAATAVAEVGRDHDYDWAIVEPSSMRSIIQLAGRVRRHRPEPSQHNNIQLLSTNLRHLEKPQGSAAFCKPGFENKHNLLNSHQLAELLHKEQYQPLNSTPRIREAETLTPLDNLVDLEHDRLRAQMTGNAHSKDIPNSRWWETPAPLTAWFQKTKPFRDGPRKAVYTLIPDDLSEELKFHYQQDDGVFTSMDNLIEKAEGLVDENSRTRPWAVVDYKEELKRLSNNLNLSLRHCAEQYGRIELSPPETAGRGWCYQPLLGFSRRGND